MYGLFHARKLRAHELALRAGWDTVHPRLRLTKPFYDRFTPAIAATRLRAAAGRRGRPATRRSTSSRSAAVSGRAYLEAARDARGELAIVLHTHMPYVEGFGTWPFGEEWLWEAIAGCYLPLLDLLDARRAADASRSRRCSCDQLEAPGPRSASRRSSTARAATPTPRTPPGCARAVHERLARELERSWSGDYERALERFRASAGATCLARVRAARTWTSSATHAVLPLLATDAGVRLQVQAGRRTRTGRASATAWRGGSGCPSAPTRRTWSRSLADAGVAPTCVELTAPPRARRARAPAAARSPSPASCCVPIDRATIALVWSDAGYPADGAYRDYHRHTIHHHHPWGNDGERLRPRAGARPRARARRRLRGPHVASGLRRDGDGLPGRRAAVCALDTELLGHWWYEGVALAAAP